MKKLFFMTIASSMITPAVLFAEDGPGNGGVLSAICDIQVQNIEIDDDGDGFGTGPGRKTLKTVKIELEPNKTYPGHYYGSYDFFFRSFPLKTVIDTGIMIEEVDENYMNKNDYFVLYGSILVLKNANDFEDKVDLGVDIFRFAAGRHAKNGDSGLPLAQSNASSLNLSRKLAVEATPLDRKKGPLGLLGGITLSCKEAK